MPERILIMGLNWIGDAVMSMPAVQACRAENPDAEIALLIKPYLKPLWEMHAVPDAVFTLGKMGETVAKIRAEKFNRALILPNSFRSALIPFLAGIPERAGLKGDHRRLMLTEVVPLSSGHQSNEYFPILAPKFAGKHELPELTVPPVKIPLPGKYAVFMPGAARGASKMWPLKRFEELSRKLLAETGLNLVFAGGTGDAPACAELAGILGDRAQNMAGKTGLKEWAGLLKGAEIAVANDSGGMHLAAAVGTPVVGIYGITDPGKTGPLAEKYRVIQHSTVRGRDIARNSEEAVKALESISAEEVFTAVCELLGK